VHSETLKTNLKVILLPLHRYIDSNWGSEYAWAINIAKGVAGQGISYTAVIGETDKETRTMIESTGNEVIELGVGREWDFRSDMTFYAKLLFQGIKLVAKKKPHLVHHVFPMGYRAGFNPLIVAGGGPSVIGPLTLPSFDSDDEPQLLRYLGDRGKRSDPRSYPFNITSSLYRKTLLKASHVLFDSEETRLFISKFEPRVKNKRYTVVPSGGVDPSFRLTRVHDQGQGGGLLTLGTLSYLRKKKHIDTLIRAVSLVKNRQVRLMIGGDGELKSKLSRLAVEVGVSDRVVFLGRIHRSTAPEYLSKIDVLCSIDMIPHETMPSVQEAMTCGRPIIASARSPPPQMRELSYGFIVDAESPKQVASAIEHFTSNPNSVLEKGRTARDFAVENFSLESVGKKIKEAYMSCLEYS
jgi:glycosyltransferase involved in cell wall biosynthesis